MLFMIIEKFENADMLPVYRKFRDSGRMLPDGLRYLDSWVEPNFSRCFQLIGRSDDSQSSTKWLIQIFESMVSS